MKRLFVLAILAACGSSPHQKPDGGPADAGTDGADAAPDSATCTSPTDTDGDGICDSLDVCPDVADPGQVDLDGDHIGWMCDPIESVTMDADGIPQTTPVSIHEDTFAARTVIQCSSGYPPCGHELLEVSGAGMVLARSDSTAAADAWQAIAAAPWLEGPLVTADDRVLWSRGYNIGDTGDYDLATRTFTSRASGVLDSDINETVMNGTLPEALGLSTTQDELTHVLVDVKPDGTLPTVATAQGFSNLVAGDSLAIPNTPRAIVTVRNNFHTGLQLYTRGASALADILAGGTPLTGLDELEWLVIDGAPGGFCALRAGHAYAVTWDAAGTVSTYELPAADCLDVAATDRGGARIFYKGSGTRAVLGYTFAGAFHALASDQSVYFVNDTLPLYFSTFDTVWKIDTNGTASQIASNLDAPIVSVAGTTVHILSHHGDPANGTWDLTRIRPNQATASVTLLANQPNAIGASVFTTAEGAALVSFGGNAPSVIVPSQSMTPVTSTIGDFAGGIRDGRTVVFSNPQQTGAPYVYSETNGTPQLTLLDSAGAGMGYTLIDAGPTQHPTSWFAYGNQTTGCKLARFTTGTTLETIPCDSAAQISELGTRADGALLVADGHVYALASTGGQRIGVGYGASFDTMIFDTTASPPILVGWDHAEDASKRFACLAMQPQRCWEYPTPGTSGRLWTSASATSHNGEAASS